jgi:hypothetical protein
MGTNINYEKVVRSLVVQANQFLSEDIVLLECTDKYIRIEFVKINLFFKEYAPQGMNDYIWKRLLIECFNNLSGKYAN